MSGRPKVEIYSTGSCGYCARTRRLLERKGVAFEEIRIDRERGRRAEMHERCGRDSVPQVFVDGRHLGGYEDLVDLDMDAALDPLLGLGNPDPEPPTTMQSEGKHDGR
jgi:glutaredoxin 3